MKLETEWAQMDSILLNSDQFGVVLPSLAWNHHPVSLNNQWKETDGMSHSVGVSITHIYLKKQQFSGWAPLFHSGCWGSWRHGLTGQRVFRQLQVDKMIPTLNDSIIITENITTNTSSSHLTSKYLLAN